MLFSTGFSKSAAFQRGELKGTKKGLNVIVPSPVHCPARAGLRRRGSGGAWPRVGGPGPGGMEAQVRGNFGGARGFPILRENKGTRRFRGRPCPTPAPTTTSQPSGLNRRSPFFSRETRCHSRPQVGAPSPARPPGAPSPATGP